MQNYYIELRKFALTFVCISFDWIKFDVWISSLDYADAVSILLELGSVVHEKFDVRNRASVCGDDCFRDALRKWTDVNLL